MSYFNSRKSYKMFLSIQMIVDHMDKMLWSIKAQLQNDVTHLIGCQIFFPEVKLNHDILYILPEAFSAVFPINEYSYVTSANVNGNAPNIHSIDKSTEEITNLILDIFLSYHNFENALNNTVNSGGSLTDLCRIGEMFFENPMFIHDSMFAVIGLPKDINTSTQFEHNTETGLYHIPLSMIDDFKFDENYRKSLSDHHAKIWVNSQRPNSMRSLYVNLWDGNHYCGRVLINERNTALLPGQLIAAEYFAEYALMIIRRDAETTNHHYKSFENTLIDLATGRSGSEEDLIALLEILAWKPNHKYICIRVQSRNPSLSINPISAIRSVLLNELSQFTSFLYEQQLCIIINLSLTTVSSNEFQQKIAPYIRDNYMCCGYSNIFTGINYLKYAFIEAGAALMYASMPNTSSWIVSFEKCSIDYICTHALKELPLEVLVSQWIKKLKSYDKEKGTEYYITLREWLRNERSIPKTSEALIIHRTTLTYRLEKLKELLPIDLNDEKIRLYLSLSYIMLENSSLYIDEIL